MISLYDDAVHVSRACTRLEAVPGDRFLINWVNCRLGESAEHTRWFALFVVLATVGVVVSIFGRQPIRIRAYFLIALHPMVLFPFFYAAQLSTALSVFWAAMTLHTLILFSMRPGRLHWSAAPLCISLGVIGSFLRLESLVFLGMLVGAWALKLRIEGGKLNLENIRSKSPRFLTCLTLVSAVLVASSAILRSYTVGKDRLVSVASSAIQAGHYPTMEWYGSQVLAVGQYLFNFFFPAFHSFFGSWGDWALFLDRPLLVTLAIGLLILVIVLGFALIPWWIAVGRKGIAWFAAGVVLLICSSFLVSALPRVDWYYPIRQYTGTILASVFIVSALDLKASDRFGKIYSLLVIYLGISSAYSVFFHYSSKANFIFHEEMFSRNTSPNVLLMRADEALAGDNFESAAQLFEEAYEAVSPRMAEQSGRGALFRIDALHGLFRTYRLGGSIEHSRPFLEMLMRLDHSIGVYACLSAQELAVEVCARNQRSLAAFCAQRAQGINPVPGHLPLRVEPNEFCRVYLK